MDNLSLLRAIVSGEQSPAQWKEAIMVSPEFDQTILQYQHDAEAVWRRVKDRFEARDSAYHIPYKFVESPKLYAMDALVIVNPLISDTAVLTGVAELFVVFYLIVHYFDDHVEHRDKFYSKFDFDQAGDIDSQHGAAPFSFMLIAFDIMAEIVSELPAKPESQLRLMADIRHQLTSQTRYFSLEKKSDIASDEVVEIKQRQVSGTSLAILANTLRALSLPSLQHVDLKKLEEGLIYVGSLTQITDDIRDLSVDQALRNANILTALNGDIGLLSDLYDRESQLATQCLQEVYDAPALTALLSLPFYPFLVTKRTVA